MLTDKRKRKPSLKISQHECETKTVWDESSMRDQDMPPQFGLGDLVGHGISKFVVELVAQEWVRGILLS